MLVIPTVAVPNQTFNVVLAQQAVRIDIAQNDFGMFLTLYIDAAPVAAGVICQDRNRIVRAPYTGFIGDLAFVDTQGTDDPVYTGLNTRWFLVYLEAGDL